MNSLRRVGLPTCSKSLCFAACLCALLAGFAAVHARAQSNHPATITENIEIDANAKAQPFPHFWERMFGSGRAILTLRESYRNDLRAVRGVTGMEYVRFHAIFHDETGLYDEDEHGAPAYNFSYIDQIYDGLLENKVRPFIELSFMPRKLSSDPNAVHPFWYKQNVAPPKDWGKWEQLIVACSAPDSTLRGRGGGAVVF